MREIIFNLLSVLPYVEHYQIKDHLSVTWLWRFALVIDTPGRGFFQDVISLEYLPDYEDATWQLRMTWGETEVDDFRGRSEASSVMGLPMQRAPQIEAVEIDAWGEWKERNAKQL